MRIPIISTVLDRGEALGGHSAKRRGEDSASV
jgi:hypothetical protein